MNPLISVIIPTRNSGHFLEACLESIKKQTYGNIEIIVVDRDSTDTTKAIARQFTNKVYNYGPERSSQRNYGAAKASGQFLAIIDSDMELTPKVLEACVRELLGSDAKAIIIPEESFGDGFWAKCKALEKSFYLNNDDIEAARFFPASVYRELNGYDESLNAGEDWDLNYRARRLGHVGRIREFIQHNEGSISLTKTLRKKFHYARYARHFLAKTNTTKKLTAPGGPLSRYKLFFSNPQLLLERPHYGLGMIFMKTAEYAAGALGYYSAVMADIVSKPSKKDSHL